MDSLYLKFFIILLVCMGTVSYTHLDVYKRQVYGGQTVKFDDKTYAMPAETDIWLTYYNKKIFDDAGVPYPEAEGWTWEKYVETAEKLTDADKGIYGSFLGDDPALEYVLASQSGISAYKEDGTANFDDPIYRENMEWLYSPVSYTHLPCGR